MNDDNIKEVEVFSSNDTLLIELICNALEKANIEFIKLPNGTAMDDFMTIYTGVNYNGYTILVSDLNESKALLIVKEAVETYNAKVDDKNIPEELKDTD